MSFNFGNTSAISLGAANTPNKNTSFGNFGFGGTPVTGTTAFGTTAATPAIGAFGAAAPTFGSTPATTAPAFGFGQNATTSILPTFGGFGTQQAAPTATSTFGFGATQPQQTGTLGPGFGGFGTTSNAAPGFGSLGTTTSTVGAFAPGAFGGAFGGFGTTAPTTTTTPFLSKFGQTNPPTGFSGFGTSLGTVPTFGSTFGQPQQQLAAVQPAIPLNPDEALAQSIFNVAIFGDERDTVIAKFNYLQAMWGTGKAFYSQNAPPVEITPQNYFCRFKTICYNKMPGKDNKLGLISFTFNKPLADIKGKEQQFIAQLNQILGNKPNIMIVVDSVKPLADNKCQLIFYIAEKSAISNETKRIVATEVFNFLNQPMTKTNITNMGVSEIVPLVLPDEDQIKEYLENPPRGIDPRMWKQARDDNPDPATFIPIPIIGFNELQWRIKCQESEAETHAQYLAKVQKDIVELKQRHASTTAKIMEHRRKLADLNHRVLNIIVKQESTRKLGVALAPEEEIIRSKLENMQALVSAPTQFKGRLRELLSQMRMQKYQLNNGHTNVYSLDEDSSEEMKMFLTMQQKAMEFLIETVNKDMKSLKTISDGLRQMVRE